MGLEQLGTIGYEVSAFGVLFVTIAFLSIVRWWTDILGRVLAAVLSTVSLILILTLLRLVHIQIPGLIWWRIILFWSFGLAVWAGLFTMIWAQFLAPRLRYQFHDRLTTPRRRGHEEADLADSRPDRDGGTHNDSTGER